MSVGGEGTFSLKVFCRRTIKKEDGWKTGRQFVVAKQGNGGDAERD
jgi:hypothetical protein